MHPTTKEQSKKASAGPWSVREVGTTLDHEGDTRVIAEVRAADGEILVDATYLEDARVMAAGPELVEMLGRLEVAANTVAYCYDKRPENFAAAMRDMKDYAESARALIAKATGA